MTAAAFCNSCVVGFGKDMGKGVHAMGSKGARTRVHCVCVVTCILCGGCNTVVWDTVDGHKIAPPRKCFRLTHLLFGAPFCFLISLRSPPPPFSMLWSTTPRHMYKKHAYKKSRSDRNVRRLSLTKHKVCWRPKEGTSNNNPKSTMSENASSHNTKLVVAKEPALAIS